MMFRCVSLCVARHSQSSVPAHAASPAAVLAAVAAAPAAVPAAVTAACDPAVGWAWVSQIG